MLEQHMPWELEVKAAESLGKDYCGFCRKQTGYKTEDCPKKYGRVVNSLNIYDEVSFKRQQEEIGKCPVCQGDHTFMARNGYD